MSELEEKSIDPTMIQTAKKAQVDGCETIFHRAETPSLGCPPYSGGSSF